MTPSPASTLSVAEIAARNLKLDIGEDLKRADACLEHQEWVAAARLYREASKKLDALQAMEGGAANLTRKATS